MILTREADDQPDPAPAAGNVNARAIPSRTTGTPREGEGE
jgi:hypothetical protein